jgi:phage shock protein C
MAEYFGFNLRVTRILAIIAFFMAMPMAIFSYLAIMFLVPAQSTAGKAERGRSDFRKAVRSTPRQTLSDVRSRFQSLNRRLARLEKYVTSSRYNLDREFRDLEQH